VEGRLYRVKIVRILIYVNKCLRISKMQVTCRRAKRIAYTITLSLFYDSLALFYMPLFQINLLKHFCIYMNIFTSMQQNLFIIRFISELLYYKRFVWPI
jgi:hypothetical protein